MDGSAGQIRQMIGFIDQEAREKAAEITKKGDEEFNIEVHRLTVDGKDRIRKKLELEQKKAETQSAIAKSLSINRMRLEKIKARQEVIALLAEDVKEKLKADLKNESTNKQFLTKLIAQGLLMFLEDKVSLQCREADAKLVESCVGDAEKEYSKVIKEQTGADKKVTVSVDKSKYLEASCLGGVRLACADGKISIDNTIDLRLKLVMEQDKPAIRQQLFGETDKKAQKKPAAAAEPKAEPKVEPKAAAAAAAPKAQAAPAAAAAPPGYNVGQVVIAKYQDGSMSRATIVTVGTDKKKGQYKVNWQGYAAQYDTWINNAQIQGLA